MADKPELMYALYDGDIILCENCGGFIDYRFRYKKIGKRYQHIEQECNPYLHYYGPGKPID